MGNLCGRESDPFAQPGRRLDSAPATPASVSVPAAASSHRKPTVVGGSPRTLGGGSGPKQAASGDANDARLRAAKAAQERDDKSKQGGKLKTQLAKQRGKTDTQMLLDASETERQYRTVDQSTGALAHS